MTFVEVFNYNLGLHPIRPPAFSFRVEWEKDTETEAPTYHPADDKRRAICKKATVASVESRNKMKDATMQKILSTLGELGEATSATLSEKACITREYVNRLLLEMCDDGRVEKCGRSGRYQVWRLGCQ